MATGEYRYEAQFGYGKLHKNNLPLKYAGESDQKKAEIVGWAGGCEKVKEYTDPNHPRGPKIMFDRYSDINLIYQELINLADDRLWFLRRVLVNPVKRLLPEEQVGIYESESVPVTFRSEMAPLCTPEIFSITRIVLEGPGDIAGEKFGNIRDVLTELVPKSHLVDARTRLRVGSVKLGNTLVTDFGVDEVTVLGHLLSRAHFEAHNCRSTYSAVMNDIYDHAPQLDKVLQVLASQPEEELKAKGIMDLSLLEVTKVEQFSTLS